MNLLSCLHLGLGQQQSNRLSTCKGQVPLSPPGYKGQTTGCVCQGCFSELVEGKVW